MLRLLACLLVLAMLLGASPAPEGSDAPGSARAKVIELMDLTGAKSMGHQVAQAMISQAWGQGLQPLFEKRLYDQRLSEGLVP